MTVTDLAGNTSNASLTFTVDTTLSIPTLDMVDASDRVQELTFQLSGLDDLDTSNPVVRAALRRSYGHWIEQAGVDAFRVDTAFHVPPDVFPDFLDGDGDDAPGVREVAMGTGRDDFLVFGEGFAIDPPFADAGAPDGIEVLRDMLREAKMRLGRVQLGLDARQATLEMVKEDRGADPESGEIPAGVTYVPEQPATWPLIKFADEAGPVILQAVASRSLPLLGAAAIGARQ